MNAPAALDSELFADLRAELPALLPGFLPKQRWFGGKARAIRSTEVVDAISFGGEPSPELVLLVRVDYASGTAESYVMPLVVSAEAHLPEREDPGSLSFHSARRGVDVHLANAVTHEGFLDSLLIAIEKESIHRGIRGEIRARKTAALRSLRPDPSEPLAARALRAEQSNSSIVYGDRLVLKFFRRAEDGVNLDLEIGTFLSERAHFANVPPVAGSLEYRDPQGKRATLGILQGFVANQGDAWQFTLAAVSEAFRTSKKAADEATHLPPGETDALSIYQNELPAAARDWLGAYLPEVELLAKRTAAMHAALASDSADRAFAPEPFTDSYQRVFEESCLESLANVFSVLRQRLSVLPAELKERAENLAEREVELAHLFHNRLGQPIDAMRTRIHGDYHLGQVLYTGADFIIIDFEGEPARPLAERRIKRSPMQDVAGMMRSFHYAAFAGLLAPAAGRSVSVDELRELAPVAESWHAWVASRFLKAYFDHAGAAASASGKRADALDLLRMHLLEKAIYELGYELNNRPTWVGIPLEGITKLLST
ncbi:MAG: putative maltokinase [Candidatus Acidiferrales bacterium]